MSPPPAFWPVSLLPRAQLASVGLGEMKSPRLALDGREPQARKKCTTVRPARTTATRLRANLDLSAIQAQGVLVLSSPGAKGPVDDGLRSI